MKRAILVFILVAAAAVAVVALFFMLRSSGLASKEVPVASLSPTHAAIALWMAGDRDAALSLLADGDAGSVETVQTIPTLNMSETEYMNLSERATIDAGKLNMEAGEAARDLARALMEEARSARDAGNAARADSIVSIVERMADEFTQPGKSLFWQQQGEAIKLHILNIEAGL